MTEPPARPFAPGRIPLVFIAGLPRIGSTLLDMVLGCHPRFVGVGELFELLHAKEDLFAQTGFCTCGEDVDHCPFWGRVRRVLAQEPQADVPRKYELVFAIFRQVFGEKRVMVDSSKHYMAFSVLAGMDLVDLKVIYLVRDVRAWVVSRLDERVRRPALYEWGGFYARNLISKYGWRARLLAPFLPWLTRSAYYFFLLWYGQNRRYLRTLADSSVSCLHVGYEELAMDSERALAEVCRFLGEEVDARMFRPANTQSHVLVGNLARSDPKRLERIAYDGRWMSRLEWITPSCLFTSIMRRNNEWVYRRQSIFEDRKRRG